MSRIIFILGHPGTGKSSSLRNLKAADVNYITASGKELPYVPDFNPVTATTLEEISALLPKAKKPIIVIDDFNFAMANVELDGLTNPENTNDKNFKFKTYDKIKLDFRSLISALSAGPAEQNVYILAHVKNNQDRVTMMTVGQAIDNGAVPPEGYTNIVLEAVVDPLEGFVFRTKTDGKGVKSPVFGEKPMFDSDIIENDIKLVDNKIRDYFKKGKK